MACKICERKETKKRLINDNKICSECIKKLKLHNYELINVNNENLNSSPRRSINDEHEDNDDNDELRIRDLITECMLQVNQQNTIILNALKDQIIKLQNEVHELRTINNPTDNRHPIYIEDDIHVHQNRFQPLSRTPEEPKDFTYDDDAQGAITNSYPAKKNTWINGIDATRSTAKRRPQVIVKQRPENEKYFKRVVPGNANYADIAKKGKKTCVIGASIVKRINMREFNDYLEKGVAIKRYFNGATASKLSYYIEEVLNEENLDRIIINIGANNISNGKQSAKEISKEIMDLVIKCHDYGVNDIFVSGITFSPYHQLKIRELNELLKANAATYNYTFIDNSDIGEQHLWKDKLHLNNQGTINLACNFLDFLNMGFVPNPFY